MHHLGQKFGSMVAVRVLGRLSRGLGRIFRESANRQEECRPTFAEVAPNLSSKEIAGIRHWVGWLVVENNMATFAMSGEPKGVGMPADVWVEAMEPGFCRG